jgi:RNAse (barnase) inhibitor barstar
VEVVETLQAQVAHPLVVELVDLMDKLQEMAHQILVVVVEETVAQ